MPRRAWLTPDSIPDPAICRVLHIPNDVGLIIAVSGALDELCYAENWEQFGTVSPEDAAYAMQEMLWRYFNDGSVCMIGAVIAYATSAVPENALDCDGATYNRVDYPDLYAVLDSVYIVDADTFTVPDIRSRAVVGAGTGTGLSPIAIGGQLGEETHVLTTAEMPSHAHTDTGHLHALAGEFPGLALAPGELPVDVPGSGEFTAIGNANITSTGGGGAHNNIQPSYGLRYCIVAR